MVSILDLPTEFRRHKTADNPLHIIGFLSQWKHYLDSMEKGELDKGRMLDMDKLEKVSSPCDLELWEERGRREGMTRKVELEG